MRENKMKQILDEGKLAVGMGIFTGSPIVVQMIGYSGFDFVFIDMEHTPVTIDRELQALIIAANESGMGTCVRVKYNDEVLIRTTAEFGADAVVVPHCSHGLQKRRLWLLS